MMTPGLETGVRFCTAATARNRSKMQPPSVAAPSTGTRLASSDFAGQCRHGVGKARPDLLVGQSAFLEAGVSMRDGKLEIEYPRAERGQDFAELGLRPDRPERAGARADDEHRLIPEHVRRDRARDPVDRVL